MGGGGGGANYAVGMGCGAATYGGPGAYLKAVVPVVGGTSYDVTVGTGGAGCFGTCTGVAGGNSSFGALSIAGGTGAAANYTAKTSSNGVQGAATAGTNILSVPGDDSPGVEGWGGYNSVCTGTGGNGGNGLVLVTY